jgi:hypothetical protein
MGQHRYHRISSIKIALMNWMIVIYYQVWWEIVLLNHISNQRKWCSKKNLIASRIHRKCHLWICIRIKKGLEVLQRVEWRKLLLQWDIIKAVNKVVVNLDKQMRNCLSFKEKEILSLGMSINQNLRGQSIHNLQIN